MFRTLRIVDLAVITIVTMVASTGVTAWLGLKDTSAVIALTMGLACPAARRMIAWRRGVAAVQLGTERGATAVLLLAMLPWMIVPALGIMPWHAVSSLATLRVDLPVVVRWVGVVLTMIGVLRPMAETLRGTGRIRSSAYIESVGLFVATGSAFLGVLAAAWLLVEAKGLQAFAFRDRSTAAAQPVLV